ISPNWRSGPGAGHLPRHHRSPWRPDPRSQPARGRRPVRIHAAAERGRSRGRGRIPPARRAAPRTSRPVTEAKPQEPLVLVIEDEPQMLRFLRPALQGNGFRIIEAANGRAGITEAAMQSPDVVLLDLGLPDVDGLEVTSRLREWSQVPIVVISA